MVPIHGMLEHLWYPYMVCWSICDYKDMDEPFFCWGQWVWSYKRYLTIIHHT